ncbi:MAG: DUF3048 domain-containing protein [Acidimicrobiales bacterium]
MARTAKNQPLAARRARRAGATVALAALAAGSLTACGARPKASAATTQPTTTTVPPTTTTTEPPPPPVAPLTGLAQPDATQLSATAVMVKIDNVDAARPQTAVNQADVVYEEMVEGGLTRLAAVFQSAYPGRVGPVRSGRLTDSAIADDLNHPVLLYSGTNAMFYPVLRSQPLTDVDSDNHPGLFYRSGPAPEPHNLYSSVAAAAKLSSTHAPPPPLWAFRAAGTPMAGAGVTPAAQIDIGFPDASIRWTWDASSNQWLRYQNGTADMDSAGTQLSASNLVVQFVGYRTSGMATGEGVPPTPIPQGELVGSGTAWFLSGGAIVKGTWSRASLTSVTVYKDSAGNPIALAPGRTWVELPPTGTVPAVAP